MDKTRKPKVAKREAVKSDRRAVKDLAPRSTQDVKGGETSLLKSCASGTHIKEATITH